MLEYGSHKAVNLTCVSEEYLALAVLDILLNVKRHRLSDAEILHVLWYYNSHLSAQLEEMIYSMT